MLLLFDVIHILIIEYVQDLSFDRDQRMIIPFSILGIFMKERVKNPRVPCEKSQNRAVVFVSLGNLGITLVTDEVS